MIRYFFIFFLFSGFAYAAPKEVELSFDQVPLVEFVNVVYGDILKENFAVDPSLVSDSHTVTVHFQSHMDKQKIASYMANLLDSVGVVIEKRPGYLLLKSKDVDADKVLFYYRPFYRSVSYITSLVYTFFDSGRFSFQRGVKIGAGSGRSTSSSVPVSEVGASATGPAPTGSDDKEVDGFVFQGSSRDVERLQGLLSRIDTPAGEVVVKGVVYEVGSTASDGSAFNLALSILGGRFGVTLGPSKDFGSGFRIKTGDGNSVDALFSALSQDSRFKVVSSPRLRVKSGSSASFSVGQDVPVLGAVQVDRNGNPVQSVEYKPSGVLFKVQPYIRGGEIDLTLSQQISSFVRTDTGVNNSPTLMKRELVTHVSAQSDELIMIGGLDEDKSSGGSSGFPFLPAFLRPNSSDSSHSQILLVLHVQKI